MRRHAPERRRGSINENEGMKMMLEGQRILNTRPKGQGTSLTQQLRALGAECIEIPAIHIQPTETWLDDIPPLQSIHHAIFTSTNAVHCFFNTIIKHNIPWPECIKTIAIGHKTASALTTQHIKVSAVPDIADSEHLLRLSTLQGIIKKEILLIKGEGGRALIAQALRQRGAALHTLNVYRRTLPGHSSTGLQALWQNDAVDIILFTSEEAIRNTFTLFGKAAKTWLCSKPCLVISQRLKNVASSLGIKHIIISQYDAIPDTLCRTLKNKGYTHGDAF